MISALEIAWLAGRLLGEPDDGIDDRLEMPMPEHHGPEHHLFAELLGFRFHHQDGILRASHDELEFALGHFVELRVKDVFVVDETNSGSADRSHEGYAG